MKSKTMFLALLPAVLAALTSAESSYNVYFQQNESEEEGDFMTTRVSVLCVLTILVMLSVFFEVVQEYVEEKVSEDMEPIVRRLWGEMTTLGFLSVITFVFVKTGVLKELSEKIFKEEEELPELVESIHMILFLVMCIFLVEVIFLIVVGTYFERMWKGHHCKYFLEKQHKKKDPKVTNKFSLAYFHQRSYEAYCLLHAEFVNSNNSKLKIPESFDLSEYLAIRMSHILEHLVHISPKIWMLIEIFFVFIFLLMECSVHTQTTVAILGMYFAFFILCWVVSDLRQINEKLKPRPLNALSQDEEMAPLLATGLHVPYRTIEVSNRSKLGALLLGRPPNQHEKLFWFDRHGPSILMNYMRVMLLISALYFAVFSIYYSGHLFNEYSTPVAVVIMIFAYLVLPLIWITCSLVVYFFTVSTSIEMMKSQNDIKKAMRRTATRSALASLKLLGSLRQQILAMSNMGQIEPGTILHEVEIDPEQKMQFENVFNLFDKDNSGDINAKELKQMVEFTGQSISDERLAQMMKEADTDGNNTMDKDEFVRFMARHSNPDSETGEELYDMMFKVFDKDGSGTIDDDEFQDSLKELGTNMTQEDVSAILSEVDHDRSGQINLAEFCKLIESHLED